MTANQFRAIRTGLGLTQAQLALVLGCTSNYVARMEQSGKHSRAVPQTLATLMQAFAAGYRPFNWPSPASRAS